MFAYLFILLTGKKKADECLINEAWVFLTSESERSPHVRVVVVVGIMHPRLPQWKWYCGEWGPGFHPGLIQGAEDPFLDSLRQDPQAFWGSLRGQQLVTVLLVGKTNSCIGRTSPGAESFSCNGPDNFKLCRTFLVSCHMFLSSSFPFPCPSFLLLLLLFLNHLKI